MKKTMALVLLSILIFSFGMAMAQSSTDTVVTEEYVPKVIIEGKWGPGPGEFGSTNPGFVSEKAPDIHFKPSSLAVDSKGNIYILDPVNNRIQKFDENGKYIKSISVESHIGETVGYLIKEPQGTSEPVSIDEKEKKYKSAEIICPIINPNKIRGINIVIDSQDNLYYYCVKRDKGEVWQFKDDKLINKWDAPIGGSIGRGQGMVLDDKDDSVWIYNIQEKGKQQFDKSYEFKKRKVYSTKERSVEDNKIEKEYKKQKNKKITPIERLKQFHFEMTDTGIRLIQKYEAK